MTRKWISDARPKPDPIGVTRDLRQNRVGLSIEAFIGNPHRIKAARLASRARSTSCATGWSPNIRSSTFTACFSLPIKMKKTWLQCRSRFKNSKLPTLGLIFEVDQ